MSEVVLSELAEVDLTDIWEFIAQDNTDAVDRLIDEIHEKCQFLAAAPKMGRQRPELDPSLRSFVIGNYVIFYRQSTGGIEVARVLHGHRDIASLSRPWVPRQPRRN
ncbi:MAG: type II toxin-antitoxin system RelE/ParE family toxin [Deltaproteobacteria bacterium]|nr:type II toxin-antitoxin system RelE/ParE family toxin [Deltaproteobacteria bacterium]